MTLLSARRYTGISADKEILKNTQNFFNENGKAQIIKTGYLLSVTSQTSYLNTLDLNNIDAHF